MDHFCPWTGTTIAKLNLPYFHTFLCMLMAGLIYAMLVVALALGNNENPYLRGSRHTGQVRSGLVERGRRECMPPFVLRVMR